MYKKYSNVVFILIFICMLGIPILTTNTERNKILTTEHRRVSPFPTFFDDDGNLMGGGKPIKGLENWINDNIGLRNISGIIKTSIDWIIFDEYKTNIFFKGEDGWISEGQDKVISDYINYGFDNVDITKYTSFYTDLYEVAKKNNIPMVATLIPDKKDVYPEKFSNDINRVNSVTRSDKVVNFINNNTDIPFIDMKAILTKYKDIVPLYWKTVDPSHWNYVGGFIGYTKIIHEIKKYFPNIKIYNKDDYKIEKEIKSKSHNSGFSEEYYKFTPKFKVTSKKINSISWANGINLPIKKGEAALQKYVNRGNENAPKLLIFGDSYLEASVLPQFLKHSFSEIIFIYSNNVNRTHLDNPKEMVQYYIDKFKPDIILSEMVTRLMFEK